MIVYLACNKPNFERSIHPWLEAKWNRVARTCWVCLCYECFAALASDCATTPFCFGPFAVQRALWVCESGEYSLYVCRQHQKHQKLLRRPLSWPRCIQKLPHGLVLKVAHFLKPTFLEQAAVIAYCIFAAWWIETTWSRSCCFSDVSMAIRESLESETFVFFYSGQFRFDFFFALVICEVVYNLNFWQLNILANLGYTYVDPYLFLFRCARSFQYETIRERPKSAPHPRLKNSKRTSKFPSIGELGLLLWKKMKKVSQCRKKLKGRTLWDFSTSILLQNSKKAERKDPLGFFNIHSVAKLQKIEGAFRGEKKFFWKKSHSAEKMDPLISSGIVCYAGNLFGSVPWANKYILASSENFVELLVDLFWSVPVVLKKHWRKAMTIVDSFLKKSAD